MAVWKIKERNELVRANDVKGTRGFVSGGQDPGGTSAAIDMLIIETQGSAVDFGDITIATNQLGGGNAGSSTRAFVRFGGENGSGYYETPCEVINTKGGTGAITSTFGTLTVGASGKATCSNQVRAVMGGGAVAPNGNPQNVIDYFTIATYGNAADFGDLTVARGGADGLASPTRGIFCGGFVGPSTMKNEMDYITIASTGNAADFGDLDVVKRHSATGSNQTRGIIGGGQSGGSPYPTVSTMAHITIASTGNAVDFGDLTSARQSQGVSNQIHLLACGGSNVNTIDKISFSNLANGVDFGDLTKTYNSHVAASDGHGGLDDNNYIDIQRPSVTYMPGSGRALFAGGQNPGLITAIDLTHISTLGNSSDFGNLITAMRSLSNASSMTRALSAGGYGPDYTDTIESVEFATEGNASDFGNLIGERYDPQSGNVGNTTRGIFAGGHEKSGNTQDNVIQYITIATAGNATDFGNLTVARQSMGGVSSNTRGVFGGGTKAASPYVVNTMDYITTASTGNATDFGDLSATRTETGGLSSSTRGVFGGGYTGGVVNIIEYITIASTGDVTDFGNLVAARQNLAPASNSTRGLIAGGSTGSDVNTIDYITIASTGNAADFGDLTAARRGLIGNSDSHGGLQA